MAYCPNCGAYVPDGQGICLACKYDLQAAEKEKTGNAAASGSAQQSASDSNAEMRRKLEEQRRRAREQNLQWAEQEKKRREEQAAREEARRIKQAEARRRAQEEYERRKAQQAQQNAANASQQQNYAGSGHYYYGSDAAGSSARTGEGNKALAALSYLSVLFVLPSILTPQDEYARFHARQGLKLFIFGILADIVTGFIGLGWLAVAARIYLMVKGISNALNGRREPLPYIGTVGDK